MVDHHSEGAMEEEWRDVIGYEGLYQVSNLGRVKSLDRYTTDKNGRVYTVNLELGTILGLAYILKIQLEVN